MNNRLTAYSGTSASPKIFAVTSGKGGVGKSVITYNLACHLAVKSRALVIDGDFFMGSQALLANVSSEYCLKDVCRGAVELHRAVVPVTSNLDLLPSNGPTWQESLPDLKSLSLVMKGLHTAALGYDYVLIDTASPVLPQTSILLHAADEVILVTTPELTAISDCYALYKVLITNRPDTAVSLLINGEDHDEEVEYIYEKFVTITSQFMGSSPAFLGRLGHDQAMVESVANQNGILEYSPESVINQQFAELISSLTGGRHVADIREKRVKFTAVKADIKE